REELVAPNLGFRCEIIETFEQETIHEGIAYDWRQIDFVGAHRQMLVDSGLEDIHRHGDFRPLHLRIGAEDTTRVADVRTLYIKRDRFGRHGAEKIGDGGAYHRIVQQYSAPLADRRELMPDEARQNSACDA